jgi:uncharacterized membrane protein YvlD (DUF360 family)
MTHNDPLFKALTMPLLLLLCGLFALSFHVIYINLGMKIIIDLGGLCKTFNVITQICNMIQSWTGMLIPSLCLILTRTD